VAALVKLFLRSSPPHALMVPVEGSTGACPSTCAGGFVIRGAHWPKRPSIRVDLSGVKHPLLHALWAPVKPGVDHPSSSSVRAANPCPATSCPHQLKTVIPLLGTFVLAGMV
jgi:hypothetical protein